MYKFSKKSKEKLETCHPDLQRLFNEVIKGYDCTVIQGLRSKEEQDEYYRTGKSKVQWPNSKHNSDPSEGVDVAPYPIQWNNTKRFHHFAGYVKGIAHMMGISIRCGNDWDRDNDLDDQTFNDLVHFELIKE